jgi:hypothetical protein
MAEKIKFSDAFDILIPQGQEDMARRPPRRSTRRNKKGLSLEIFRDSLFFSSLSLSIKNSYFALARRGLTC